MTKPIDIQDVSARLSAPILGRAAPDSFELTTHSCHPRIATIRFAPGRPIGYALSATYPDWTDRAFLAQRLAGMRLFFGKLRDIEPGLDGTSDLWYYDHLVPWIHFVPVSADLSELAEVRAWLAQEPEAAAAIAARGQALAATISFDQALLDVAPRVIAYIRPPKDSPCA